MSGGVTPAYLRSAPIRRLRHPLDESPAWSVIGGCVWALVALTLALPLLVLVAIALPTTLLLRWLLLLCHWNRQRVANLSTNANTFVSGGLESMRGNEARWLGGAWQCSVLHAVLVFETPVEVTALRQLLTSRVLPVYPRLTRRPVPLPLIAGAGYCWLPDCNFCIDNHVFPGPNFLSAESQLQEYVSQLVCKGLANDKPPWELHVLGHCAVLRVHQSVADGTALVKLLCHCLADTKIISSTMNRRKPFSFYCDVLRACLLGPLSFLFWLLMTSPDCNLLTQSAKGRSGGLKVTWSAAISFAKVTRVKQVTRSTVNCVLLSALSGALRSLLQSCGVRQPPDLKVLLPIDLRKCAQTSGKPRLGNKMAPVMMTLPVGMEGAVPRLWSTRRTLQVLKQSPDPVVVYLATATLMSLLPGHFARHLLTNIGHQKASVQFSSQIGPASSVLLGGSALKGVYALLPAQSQLNVSVSVFTYGEQLFVTVATNHALGPTGNLLLQHLHSQIELLYDLLKNRRVPGEMKSDSNLYRFPDVTRSPVKEIAYRLNYVQEEVQRLSRCEVNDSEKLQRLKAEFSHLLRELRKRKAGSSPEQDIELWDHQFRLSRRRSVSCSFTRRSSTSLLSILATNRPVSYIESTATTNTCGSRSGTPSPQTSSCVTSPTSSTSSQLYQQRWTVRRNTTGPADDGNSINRFQKQRAPPLSNTRRVSSPAVDNRERLEEILECQSSYSYDLLRDLTQKRGLHSSRNTCRLSRGVAVGQAPLSKSYSQPASINDTRYYCQYCTMDSPKNKLYEFQSQPIMPTAESLSDTSGQHVSSRNADSRTLCITQLDKRTPTKTDRSRPMRCSGPNQEPLPANLLADTRLKAAAWCYDSSQSQCEYDVALSTSQQHLLIDKQFGESDEMESSNNEFYSQFNNDNREENNGYVRCINYNYVNCGYRNDPGDDFREGYPDASYCSGTSVGLYDEILCEIKKNKLQLSSTHVSNDASQVDYQHPNRIASERTSDAKCVSLSTNSKEIKHNTRHDRCRESRSEMTNMIHYYREPCCTKRTHCESKPTASHNEERLVKESQNVRLENATTFNTAIDSLSKFANKVHVFRSLESPNLDLDPKSRGLTGYHRDQPHGNFTWQSNISSTIALSEPLRCHMPSCSYQESDIKRDISVASTVTKLPLTYKSSICNEKTLFENNCHKCVPNCKLKVRNSIEIASVPGSSTLSGSSNKRCRFPADQSDEAAINDHETFCMQCNNAQLTSLLALSHHHNQSPESLNRDYCALPDHKSRDSSCWPMATNTPLTSTYQHKENANASKSANVIHHKTISCDSTALSDTLQTQSESFFRTISHRKSAKIPNRPTTTSNKSSVSSYDKVTFI